MNQTMTRRQFLRSSLAAMGGLLASSWRPLHTWGTSMAYPPRTMPWRSLGKTGQMVSIFGLGGQALLEQEDVRVASGRGPYQNWRFENVPRVGEGSMGRTVVGDQDNRTLSRQGGHGIVGRYPLTGYSADWARASFLSLTR